MSKFFLRKIGLFTFLIVFSIFITLLASKYSYIFHTHEVKEAQLIIKEKRPYIFLRYYYSTSTRQRNRENHVLLTIDANTGRKIAQYKHDFTKGHFEWIVKDEDKFYFEGAENQPYIISFPSLEEVKNADGIKKSILLTNSEIKSIYTLEVIEGAYKVVTDDAYSYFIDIKTLKIIEEKGYRKLERESREQKGSSTVYARSKRIWKNQDKYSYVNEFIQDLIIENKTRTAYAFIDDSTYEAFILEGELRRQLQQVLPNAKLKNLSKNSYLKGIFLRAEQTKDKAPNMRWAIVLKPLYAAYIFHQETIENNSDKFLSQVSLSDGKEFWKINLSQNLDEFDEDSFPIYTWLHEDVIICLFGERDSQQQLCAFYTKNGMLKWKIEI